MNISNILDAEALLESFGPWVLVGMGIVVFIESGVLFPFLPGDSLLVTAAILREPLDITVWQILLVACVGAIAGDQVGFWLGHRFGRRLFKPDARVLKTEHLEEAEAFFNKYGAVSLVLGRFVPIVRTYVPFAAGTANMHYRHFVVWNVLGAVFWVFLMTFVGYFLGGIPFVANNIDVIAIIIIVISVMPMVIAYLNKRRKAAKEEAQPSDEDISVS